MGRLALFDRAVRRRSGVSALVGVDEAGRGPLAGPVVAAAVLLPDDPPSSLDEVRDSKRLSEAQRERLFRAVRACALRVGVGWASSLEIDRHNILQATFLAMRRAVARLRLGADAGPLVVVDGDKTVPALDLRQEALVEGDDRSLCVASASIVAKVIRDRWMLRLDRRFPDYGFARHKGYGTRGHFEALDRLGPSAEHRRSFLRQPV